MAVISKRYSGIAAFWHWLSAALVVAQFYTGWMFHDVLERGTEARATMFDWHKTLGVTLLLVALFRVATRLVKPAPPQPRRLSMWERWGAKLVHFILYAAIIGIPLLGLTAISDRGGITLLGGIPFPAVPGVEEPLADWAGDFHETIVWWFAGLLGLHIAAAFYHQLRGDAAAGRMWPFRGLASQR